MHHIIAQIRKPAHRGQRNGKGFSKGEIKKLGLNPVDARKMGLPVDSRRRTVHDENVETAKAHAEKEKAKVPSKPKKVQSPKKEKSKS